MWEAAWVAVVGAVVVAALWLVLRPSRRRHALRQTERARRLFRLEREHVEARFATLFAQQPKTTDAVCRECSFADEVTFVRQRHHGHLMAFVAVTFQAAEPPSESTPSSAPRSL